MNYHTIKYMLYIFDESLSRPYYLIKVVESIKAMQGIACFIDIVINV